MKIIILTLMFGLLGHRAAGKPYEIQSNDATDVLVEIEKQRLIKFPEELNELRADGQNPNKTDEAKRILEEIEKINQALGYVKKSESARMPAILDSSQYLFPNTGYQPFHVQNPQVMGSNGETLLLPSIRSIKMDQVYQHKASEFNQPPLKKAQKQKVVKKPANNPMYFHPHRVEVPAPQTPEEKKLLPTHFVIPVRLYKNNKQQFVEKHTPQEYKVKGYKIVGDIDHFYGKTKSNNKTTSSSKVKSTPKYHLLFLPQEVIAKNAQTEIEAMNITNSGENSSREEKLANRPLKLQTNTQTIAHGNTVNASSSATIVRKRVKPLKGEATSVLAVTSGSVIKVTPAPATGGHQQQQQSQLQHQPQQQSQLQHQQQHYQKPSNPRPNNHPLPVGTPSYLNNQQQQPPTALAANVNNNNNNDNNNIYTDNNNSNKNRNPLLNPLLGLQSNLQNNINNINNATSNAIKTAFQNIFRLPFRPDINNNNNKPQTVAVAATEYPFIQAPVLQLPLKQQQQLLDQQQYYYTLVTAPTAGKPPLYVADNYQNDHLDSDYKWDDENSSTDSGSSEVKDVIASDESQEPAQEKIFGHPIKEIQQTQKEALKQGGIIIQKLKVRRGGIAIAGPGGVATAGSGGTAIVGPGGYALTHPRSLTIAGPGAKVIAIPSNVDLKDALSRTNLKTKMIPREGRIVATGPTVYYAPGTADGVEIVEYWQASAFTTWPLQPAPLTAYTTHGLNLLTPGQIEPIRTASGTKPSETAQIENTPQLRSSVATNFPQFLTPQPYFVLNNPYYATPFTQYAYATTSNQFLPQFVQTVPDTTQTVAQSSATTTRKPKVKDAEPTTKRPQGTPKSTPPKLQLKPKISKNTAGDFRNDAPLLQAVRQINSEFIIEEIMPVPGHHIFSSVNTEKVSTASKAQQKSAGPKSQAKKQTSKLSSKKTSNQPKNSQVKVESTGRTATSGNIPQIPFGTYFLPYFSQGQQQQQEQGIKTAALILEPHSKAIVGNGGTAISTPISRAYLKRGVPTNVYFNPESVAIAGVGGKAHAQADLEHRSLDDHTLPYYGGLKGQYVHVKDGKVQKFFVNDKAQTSISAAISRQGPTAALSSSIALTAHEEREKTRFEEDFNRIQLAAARLVAIQEKAKQKGTFSSDDNRVYAASLLELGQAAQSLAQLQQTGQINDFSVLLQPYQGADKPQKTPSVTLTETNSDDAVTIEAPVEEEKVEEVTEQQFSEMDLLPVTPEDPYEDVHDSVAVIPPKKDASVAEAKPVGLSIAGVGGVASSKPNAVALSGRNGLAVSAPKATAIAGVTAQEAAAFSISLPGRNQLVIKSASTRLAAPATSASYDDYDYIEASPLQAHTRNVPLLKSSGLLRTNSNSKAKPMMETASAADDIVKMWRTAIAEDYAAPSGDMDRLDDYDIEQLYKISKKLSQRHRV